MKHKYGIRGSLVAGIVLILCTSLHKLCFAFGVLAFSAAAVEYLLIRQWRKILNENKRVVSRSAMVDKLAEAREKSNSGGE